MNTNLARTNIVGGLSENRVWLAVAGAIGFAVLTAVAAVVHIPLRFTPVPITLQTFCVLMAAATLGPRWGTISMAFYLLLGTTGYHVFAGGNWGLQTVFGATGGYLLGFVLAQPIVGLLARRNGGAWLQVLLAMFCGHAVVYACGLVWLKCWLGVDIRQALVLGLYPFLLGDALKVMLATGLGKAIVPRTRSLF